MAEAVATNGSIKVPNWVFVILGTGGIAVGGSGFTVGMGAKEAVPLIDEATSLRIDTLESQVEELDEKLDNIRDNQLLVCQALDVSCTR